MRRVLVALLAVGMAILSFDALRAYALTGRPLTDGVIPTQTILPRPWLAMLWAVTIDLAVLAGILGVKDDRRDWRAWLMLLLALAATLGFQVFSFWPWTARAVPPVGLALAILVLDLGPARPKPAAPSRTPAPARLHTWLESWNQAPVPVVPAVPAGPPAGPPGPPTERPNNRPNNRPKWSPADDPRVLERLSAGSSPNAIRTELGLTDRQYRHLLAYKANNNSGSRVNGSRR